MCIPNSVVAPRESLPRGTVSRLGRSGGLRRWCGQVRHQTARLGTDSWRFRLFALLAFLALLAGCTTVPVVRPAPDWTPPASALVLVVPPDSRLARLTAGGMHEEREDWSNQARSNLRDAITQTFATLGVSVVSYPDRGKVVPWRPQDASLVRLHEAVGGAILGSSVLPTQRSRHPYLDYGLGDAARHLHDDFGADFALFVYCAATYASSGRVALGVLAAIGGVAVDTGTLTGFASLVDLRDGKVIWFTELVPRGTVLGTVDPRTVKGAEKLADLLLADMPL